jgi:HNH endonuclease/AP2 domain
MEIIINSKKHGTHTALIDDEDFEQINKYVWSIIKGHNCFYLGTKIQFEGKKRFTLLHRYVMGLAFKEKLLIDHINHNGLDNRKENLRISTCSQNNKNRRSVENSTSKYLGVNFNKKRNRWRAQIRSGIRKIDLGNFILEDDAAKAYNDAALKYHGEFANLNKF